MEGGLITYTNLEYGIKRIRSSMLQLLTIMRELTLLDVIDISNVNRSMDIKREFGYRILKNGVKGMSLTKRKKTKNEKRMGEW